MSAKSNTETSLGLALEGYARLVTEQSLQTNQKIEVLTLNVQELVKVSIQSEERHKQQDAQNSRLEENQKSQGQKLEALRDTVLTMNKDIERNAERWSGLYKILGGVFTSALAAIVITWVNSK